MKINFTLLIALLISSSGFAQNGINYKAVIKDGSGNIVANELIDIRFLILEGAATIYSERHTPTTDNTGIVIVNIGEGTVVAGNFATIDWGNLNHSLNVQVDTGSGLVNLGTTPFKSVPYAKVAEQLENPIWSENGSDINYSSGRVGIGIINPEERLHIAGSMLLQSNLGNLNIGFPDNGSQWRMSTRLSGAQLQFGSKPDGSGSVTYHHRLNQGGEFSYGNVFTPEAWGHIQQNSTINKAHLLLKETGNDYARLSFENTFTTSSDWQIAALPSNSATTARINFFFRNSNGSANQMTLLGNGFLGVNGVPSSRLHVFQGGQSVGLGLAFRDGTANSDWNITHGFGLRFHYGNTLKGLISATTGAYIQGSDARLKENVSELTSVLNKVAKIRPATYTYKADVSKKQAVGVIAQEVQHIFPEVVYYSEADNTYGVDYAAFGIIAIKAIQEQQAEIDDLKSRLEALERIMK